MKKSLIALAVLGAVAGVAQAQTNVTIYGTVDAGITKTKNQTTAINSGDNNKIGFKGSEDLGGGLKAIFQIEQRFDRLDVLVNNVGDYLVSKPFEQFSDDDIERLYGLNLRHVFGVTRAMLPLLRKRGAGAFLGRRRTARGRGRRGSDTRLARCRGTSARFLSASAVG